MSFPVYPDLRGRTVIVTGGASGIGEAFVRAFVANEAKVAFLDMQEAAGATLAEATGALFLPCDLTALPALRDVIQQVGERLGPTSVLVNNAANDQRQRFEDVTGEQFDWMMAVNFRHVYFAPQAVLPQMREVGRGSIINMSSVAWMAGGPSMQAYSAAKAAIVGLTPNFLWKLGESLVCARPPHQPRARYTRNPADSGYTNSLARDVGRDRIRVNAIAPGW